MYVTIKDYSLFQSVYSIKADMIQKNEKLQDSVLKSIAAFLNAEGGTVIIGVEDNGNLFGLEKDIQSFKERNRTLDNFERHLVGLIQNRIGIKFLPYLKIRFAKINNLDICAVYVRKANQSAFLKLKKGVELFVRTGNSTRSLSVPEIYDYL